MKFPLLFLLVGLMSCASVYSQKNKKVKTIHVEGKAQIRINDAHCIGEVKQRVIDQAKINALELAFGKVIVQGTNTFIENVSTGERVQTNTQMNVIANSMVLGEFVEEQVDKLEWVLRDNFNNATGMRQELWLLCEVSGKARESTTPDVAFETFTMRCDDPANCETTTFKNGDRLYLHFKTPVKGYLSVFIKDFEDDVVYRVFPYTRMMGAYESAVEVNADQEYIFFSERLHKQYFPELSSGVMDPVALGTNEEQLFNRLYIVFSPEPYNKPLLEAKPALGGIKTVDFNRFQKWLNVNRARNTFFQTSNIDIVIKR